MAQNISPNMQYSEFESPLLAPRIMLHPISTFLQRGRFILKIIVQIFSLYLAIFFLAYSLKTRAMNCFAIAKTEQPKCP